MKDPFAAFAEPLEPDDATQQVTPGRLRDPDDEHAGPGLVAAIVLGACGVVVVAALWGRWITARVGGDPVVLQGIDLDVARILIVALGVAMVAIAVRDAVRRREGHSPLAVAVAATVVLMAGLLVLALETISGLVPKDLIPVTVRRLTFRLTAGPGLWLTLLAGLVGLLAASGGLHLAVERWRRSHAEGNLVATAAGQVLIVAGALVLGVGRYQDAFVASAASQDVVLEGWSTPWFGVGSVVALWALVLVLPVLLVRPSLAASSVVAFAGWFAAFLGAVLLVAGGGVEWVEPLLEARLPDEAALVADVSASLGPSALLVFLGGVVAAAGGLLTAGAGARR